MSLVLAKRPRRYFAPHYLLFRCLGMGWWHHPDEQNFNNFPKFYIYYTIITNLVWFVGFVSLETISPFIGDIDLDRFMFSLCVVITHNFTLIKIYIFLSKNHVIQDVVKTLEVDLYQFYQNSDRIWKTIKITRIMTFLAVFFGWISILGDASVSGNHVQNNQLNDSSVRPVRTLLQPIYTPWNYDSNKAFLFTFCLEMVALLWIGNIIITIDTFIASLVLHMSNQFVILQEAFETAHERTVCQLLGNLLQDVENIGVSAGDERKAQQLYRNNEVKIRNFFTDKQIELALAETLRSCILQHQTLINCVTKFGGAYLYGYMSQLLTSMGTLCVTMVQVSLDASSVTSASFITSVSLIAAVTVQLGLQCFTANELTIQAGKVADAVMNSKWELMPPRLQRLLALTMLRAQKPLQLTAAGFSSINNECFVAIMKAAYSYYAVIRQKQFTK